VKDFFKRHERRIEGMGKTGKKRVPRLVVASFLAIAPGIAHAEDIAGGSTIHVVGISREACDRISAYIPNGEADYKPGAAADGSTVAPADLDGGYGVASRGSYSFPVTIDPFRGQSPQFSAHTEMEVAQVTLDTATGRVTVDGQDVTGADRALAEACAHLNDRPAH
jgi:hypothetical protein